MSAPALDEMIGAAEAQAKALSKALSGLRVAAKAERDALEKEKGEMAAAKAAFEDEKNKVIEDAQATAKCIVEEVAEERSKWELEKVQITSTRHFDDSRIKINVGGTMYESTLTTLSAAVPRHHDRSYVLGPSQPDPRLGYRRILHRP